MKQHYLSVLAIFHNESHIMKEWIQHYIAEGVDYFYLINNFSTDDFLPILQQHCCSRVTLINSCTPNEELNSAQVESYVYMLREHIKDNTEWLIIVDFDEFMYALDPNSMLKQEIQNIENRI